MHRGTATSITVTGSSSMLTTLPSHPRQRTCIEHFAFDPAKPNIVRYVRTIASPYFLFPNSLALTLPNAFFVASDHLFTRRINLLTFTESILGGSAFPLATSRTSCFLQTHSPPSSMSRSPSHSFHFPRHCALS